MNSRSLLIVFITGAYKNTVKADTKTTSEVMSIVVDVNRVSEINQDENPLERIKKAAQDGDVDRLYELIAEDPNIVRHFDKVPFCETPLHIAAEKGKTHFAMELMTLKPSLALKLNATGFSPVHLALQNNHIQTVRGLIAINNNLVSIKGRGRITPLHHVARIGDSDLLSEFLCSCPSSVEDLTTKCETVVHIAVKNHKLEAFKVLLGWLKRVNREEILDWKDEDGNTILHVAASTNQTEVMKLSRGTVKVKAKNLDGKTAMDILRTHQSPSSLEASSPFYSAKERLLCSTPTTLARYLSNKLSSIEKQYNLFGLINLSKTRHKSLESNDSRCVILVVAILIVTAAYQATLSPPGGFWEGNSRPGDSHTHSAGQMVMPFYNAVFFYLPNGIAFFSSLYVILNLTVGLPMWKVIYGSIVALAIANFASMNYTFPTPTATADVSSSLGNTLQSLNPFVYPVITGFTVFTPFVAYFLNKRRRHQVDFPDRYFTSPHELV